MVILDTSCTEWDLSDLFASETDPAIAEDKQQTREMVERFVEKWQDRMDYLHDPQILRQALDEYEYVHRTTGSDGTAGYYLRLRAQQQQNNPQIKAQLNKITELRDDLHTQLQFFTIRIGKIPPERQTQLLNAPILAPYWQFLSRLFDRSHYQLTEAEERILTHTANPAYYQWMDMTQQLLATETRAITVDGTQEEKNLSALLGLTHHRDSYTRSAAATAVNSILSQHVDVAESELNALLSYKKLTDALRGYPRPDSHRHVVDNIATEAVDTLIDTVYNQFSLAHRFYQLKAQLFSRDSLSYFERAVPYGHIGDQYPFDNAAHLVYRVLYDLDPTFSHIFARFLNNGQIDVYPRTGKRHGAFCAYQRLTEPVYLFLNYGGKLQDVLTLAHEVGHGINNELIRQQQHSLYFGTPKTTAEVASTFMEDFVLQELLREADPELELVLRMRQLEDDISTICRQVAFYRFEWELHHQFREQGYLSHNEIGQLFMNHMRSYLGPAVTMSPGSENWWVYIPHFRRFFYVFSYASGLLISKTLQQQVRDDPRRIQDVRSFLAAGQSQSPAALFTTLGIDIHQPTVWQNGLQEIESRLETTRQLAEQSGALP